MFWLIGFRNRIVVMLDWAVAYFTYQRHARLLLGPPPAAFVAAHAGHLLEQRPALFGPKRKRLVL